MKIIDNLKLKNFDLVKQNVDDLSTLPYIPTPPLEPINMFSFFVGASGSGKTSLVLKLLCSHPTKKHPEKSRAYYKLFDKIYLISASLASLPLDKLNLNEDRIFSKYSDELMKNIIEIEQEDQEGNNVLIILDDVIKSLKNNKESDYLTRCILNRRHILNKGDGKGGSLSIWIMSQKFNQLSILFRINTSSVFLLRSVIQNQKEKACIVDELMADLNKEEVEEVFKMSFKKKYNHLLILNKKQKNERYYSNFDLIKFDSDDESDSEED